MKNDKYQIFGRTAVVLALCCVFCAPVCAQAPLEHQDDVQSQVSEVIQLLQSRKYKEAEAKLRASGAQAIPLMLQIAREEERSPASSIILHFIVSIESREAESAVIELLSDKSAYLRGFTISCLRSFGARKVQHAALPHLIGLLRDTELWLSGKASRGYYVKPDPTMVEFKYSVRGEAIEALQQITGIKLAAGATEHEQAEAWHQWWHQQQRR